MTALIGVLPLMDYGRDSLWMLPGYFDATVEAGGTPAMLPLTDDPDRLEQLADTFDGFLFTGGPDVMPELYADAERADGIAVDQDSYTATMHESFSPERDAMERALLPMVLRADKPILGICRGIQLINAVLGGTLWHDLPSEHPSGVEHHMDPPYDRFGHSVTLLDGTPLERLMTAHGFGRTIAVNSYHHQAVRRVASGLEPMAVAPDGVVEAVWRPESRFCWAVQWHPEFLHRVDERSRLIFRAFVNACERG